MFAFCVCSPAATVTQCCMMTQHGLHCQRECSPMHTAYLKIGREAHCVSLLHVLTVGRHQHQVGCCQSAERWPECLTAPLLRLHMASRLTVSVAGRGTSPSNLARCTSICRYLDVGPPCSACASTASRLPTPVKQISQNQHTARATACRGTVDCARRPCRAAAQLDRFRRGDWL